MKALFNRYLSAPGKPASSLV